MHLLRTYMKKNQVKLCPKRLVCTFVNQSKVVRTFQMPQTLQVCGSRFSRSKVKTKKTKGVWCFLSCLGTATRFFRSARFISSPKKPVKELRDICKTPEIENNEMSQLFFHNHKNQLQSVVLEEELFLHKKIQKKRCFRRFDCNHKHSSGCRTTMQACQGFKLPRKVYYLVRTFQRGYCKTFHDFNQTSKVFSANLAQHQTKITPQQPLLSLYFLG